MDQGGQDVTELFDDAGHSDEARAILKTLQIGAVKVRGIHVQHLHALTIAECREYHEWYTESASSEVQAEPG